MRRSDPLNERQLTVLRWVADGCPEKVMEGNTYKVSARALRDRGLVTVRQKAGQWEASVTDAGRYYLDHGHAPASSTRNGHQDRARPGRGGSRTRPQESATATVTVDALMENVAAADGRFTIPNPPDGVRAEWRRAIHAARGTDRVPQGMHLRHSGRDVGDLVVWLAADEPTSPQRQLEAARPKLVVPESVEQWHPLLASLTDPGSVLRVSTAALPRAMRILHVLLVEADALGFETGWADDVHHGVELRAAGRCDALTLFEVMETRPVLTDPTDAGARPMYDWQRVRPEMVSTPTGRLEIVLEEAPYRSYAAKRRWGDRQRWRLEDKLTQILAEVQTRRDKALARIASAEQARRDREQAWEQAMQQARAEFVLDRRRADLRDHVERWEFAGRIRTFCAALAATADLTDGDLQQWLSWARCYADDIDPLITGLAMPATGEPTADELRPFLAGWDPRGPG